MDDNQFLPEKYFDLGKFTYADIFDNEELVWDVIKKIPSYTEALFASGRLKGNYAENVYIAPSATVDNTARIIGPTIIGEKASIGFNAYIHGHVILDDNVVIGTGCEVKNAILLNTCKSAHFNYIGESILGNQVRIGAGALVVNKRVDRKTIHLKIGENKIDTGMTKFGAIIGDNSRVGANAVINPGTVIGQRTLVYPLESVFGLHGDDEIIK